MSAPKVVASQLVTLADQFRLPKKGVKPKPQAKTSVEAVKVPETLEATPEPVVTPELGDRWAYFVALSPMDIREGLESDLPLFTPIRVKLVSREVSPNGAMNVVLENGQRFRANAARLISSDIGAPTLSRLDKMRMELQALEQEFRHLLVMSSLKPSK